MDTETSEGIYAITAVVAQFDLTPETLVRYERAGLLRPTIVNEVRFFTYKPEPLIVDGGFCSISQIRRLTGYLRLEPWPEQNHRRCRSTSALD